MRKISFVLSLCRREVMYVLSLNVLPEVFKLLETPLKLKVEKNLLWMKSMVTFTPAQQILAQV